MAPRLKLYLLHGFLGLPSDWELLPWEAGLPGVTLEKVDLLAEPVAGSLAEWARRFRGRVADESPASGERRVLVGYSMGGRLAMHALVEAPELFDGAVFVSANPGQGSEAEKSMRREADEAWARRFESEEWAKLLRAWDAQPVFGGALRGLQGERREERFDRARLAACLRNWSVGRQENLLPRLGASRAPMLWVAGDRDRKYAEMLERLRPVLSGARFEVIEDAGHRVPWESPKSLMSVLSEFLTDF